MKSLRHILAFTTIVLLSAVVGLRIVPSVRAHWRSPQSAQVEKEKKDDKKKKDLPLEPARKVEFTTDEATWLSLDVSPDGKTIVFELLGDLYTIPIEGGEAKRITEGMAFDSQPCYSPDGQWIAFISDRDGADNVWIVKPDGTDPRKLSKETNSSILSPAWMPDSQYVLTSLSGRGGIFGGINIHMFHIQGGSGINITASQAPAGAPDGAPGPGIWRLGAAVSPDGKYLYYARKTAGPTSDQMKFGWQIVRRGFKSGDEDVITQAQGGAIRPSISPDGSTMIYGTRFETQTGLRVRDLNSGNDRWLKYPVQRDDMESTGRLDLYPGYSFTPDGRDVIVTYGGKIHRINIDTGQDREIPFTAKVSLDLGPLNRFQRRVDKGPVRSRLTLDVAQSPDGKKIAFSAMSHLYVMDLQEKKPRRVTSSESWEFKPAWSPDGQWLAYVTWDFRGQGDVWKARADGSSQPQQLTHASAFYTDLVFSPEGDRIVARRGNAWMRSQTPSELGGLRIPLDIVWLPSNGGDVSLIAPARGVGSPHFTHEKDRIYFYSRDGLLSMRYDGTDRRVHMKITGRPDPRYPQPPPASDAYMRPDGRWALARVNNQIWVAAVPPVGGNTPSMSVFSPSVPAQQLTDIGVDTYRWADDGKTVTWAVGSTFFRRPFESISFEPKKEGEGPGPAKKEAEAEKTKKPKEQDEHVQSYEVVLEFPRSKPKGNIALRDATVITMKGDEVLQNADILVTDNRIAALGPRGKIAIPADAKVIDLKGKFIVPGFVDTHAHYAMRTDGVLEAHNWSFLANLAYGVTTGLDVQTSTNDYLVYRDLVDAGMMIGPRAYSTGPGVFSNNDFQSYEAAKYVLEKYKKYYLNDNLKSYEVGNRKQRQWVVQACKELELTVTTEGGSLKLDLTHVLDGFGGNEHNLPIVPLYKDVVELYAQAKTSYTPTLIILYGGPKAANYFYETTEVHDDKKLTRFTPHNEIDDTTRRRPWFREDEYMFPKSAAQAAKIQRAGGHVGVGGHGKLQGLGYHWEMWAFAMGGMTPREVLKAATTEGAHIVGLEQDLGMLEVGKLADLVVLEKNPLENIRNTNTIRYVMKNGELFDGDTLDQIWPIEKKIPPFWWWNDKPAVTTNN